MEDLVEKVNEQKRVIDVISNEQGNEIIELKN